MAVSQGILVPVGGTPENKGKNTMNQSGADVLTTIPTIVVGFSNEIFISFMSQVFLTHTRY